MTTKGKSATRVAVLASGAGSTFEALVEAGRRGEMCAEVVLLIVSRQDAPATELARRLGVECVVLDEKLLGSAACDAAMETLLTGRRADLVVLAGYVRNASGAAASISRQGDVRRARPPGRASSRRGDFCGGSSRR